MTVNYHQTVPSVPTINAIILLVYYKFTYTHKLCELYYNKSCALVIGITFLVADASSS